MLPPCYFSYKALHKILPHNKPNTLSHSILTPSLVFEHCLKNQTTVGLEFEWHLNTRPALDCPTCPLTCSHSKTLLCLDSGCFEYSGVRFFDT